MTDLGAVLAGKSGLIVGAASGIGRAAAELFAKAGADILLTDIDEDAVAGLAAVLSAGGTRALAIRADVTSRSDSHRAVARVLEAFGKLDFLCHVAGIYPRCALDDMPEDFWRRSIDVNLTGVFLTVQASLPAMRRQHGGRIAVVSSITGPRVALAGHSAYAAAKAGVCGFVRAAALETAADNIAINAVLPGTILTPSLLRDLSHAEELQAIARATPMGRIGEPIDVAQMLLFLVSDAASFVTGQEIVVDGGALLPE